MISIHAPHEGERRTQLHAPRGLLVFQSTLPTRGSDGFSSSAGRAARDFNPRSPRGGATFGFIISLMVSKFQSTLPTRGSDSVQCSKIVYRLCNHMVYSFDILKASQKKRKRWRWLGRKGLWK